MPQPSLQFSRSLFVRQALQCHTFPAGQVPRTDVFVSKVAKFFDGTRRIVSHGGRIKGRGQRPKMVGAPTVCKGKKSTESRNRATGENAAA
jgi:hypothetical protein